MARIGREGKEIITKCCSCQKIRDKAGEWRDVVEFRLDLDNTLFSHSVCPSCLVELYPEFASTIRLNL